MKKNIINSVVLITVLNLISKALGFFRDILMASSYGTSYQADAYNMAITIPNIVFGIIGVGITTTFIPIFSEILKKEKKENMFIFANNIITIVSIITIFIGITCFTFSNELVNLIAPNFSGEIYDLTVTLTKISIINIFFMAIVSGFNAILQTLDDFRPTAYMSVLINIPVIIYLLLGNKLGVVGLTFVTVVGNLLQIIIQIPYLKKYGYKYRIYIKIKDTHISKIIKLLMPVIIGSGVAQINDIIDKMLASYLPTGSITALNLAQRLNSIIHTVFITAIITVIFPVMSNYANENNDKLKQLISRTITIISIIILPTILLIIVLSDELITMVFARGEFNLTSIKMTSTALVFYSVGTIFYGIRDVLSRTFYALQDSVSVMKNSIIGVSMNIVSNLVLVKIIGIGGLALGTTISAIVTSILMMKNIQFKIGKVLDKYFYINTAKIGIGVIIMYILLKSMIILGINNIFVLVSISMIVYMIVLYVLKIDELSVLKSVLNNKFKKNIF